MSTRMDAALERVKELNAEGYDFTWNQNDNLYDDGKCWVRFHSLGHYGTAEGTDLAEAIEQAYQQIRSTPRPSVTNPT